jgi:hypothetical protein
MAEYAPKTGYIRLEEKELSPEALGLLVLVVIVLQNRFRQRLIGHDGGRASYWSEESLVQLNYLRLEMLRSGLLREGRRLHASYRRHRRFVAS